MSVYFIYWNGSVASLPTSDYEEALAKMRFAREQYPDAKFEFVEKWD